MNNRGWVLAGIFVLLLSASLVFASIDLKDQEIKLAYSAGERISGTLNISFTNERADSLIKSNFDGSMSLAELLRKSGFSEGSDYKCTYPGCNNGYDLKGSVASINLAEDSPAFIGFKVTGENVEVTSLRFNVISEAIPSCTRQIIIDLLDKNESFIQNNKNAGTACGEEFAGCFNYGLGTYEKAEVTSNPYCENITLRPAPAYALAARIDNGTKTTTLTMKLYDTDWGFLGECNLPKPSQQNEKLSCIVNYSVTDSGDFFVCIMAAGDDSGNKIRIEEEEPACGTSSSGPPYDTDYDISASPLAFDSVGTLGINSSSFPDIAYYANSYLADVYGGNCSVGCIIPFEITGIDQSLTFAGAELKYKKGVSNNILVTNEFYELERDSSLLTTQGPLNIELENANLVIPVGSKQSKLYLYLDDKNILPKPLDITISPSFSFDVSPKTILIGPTTSFKVITPENIALSNWDFGDELSASSSGKSISHRYLEFREGGYDLSVEVVRSDGVSARRTFDIAIGSWSDSANALIRESENSLANITKDISGFSSFIADAIRTRINIEEMSTKIEDAKKSVLNGTSDEDYERVIGEIIALNIPASIDFKEEGNAIPLIIGFGNINTDYLESISEVQTGSQGEKDSLKAAIVSWFDNNYDGTISYEVIATSSDGYAKQPLFTRIAVSASKKAVAEESTDASYLIIDYPKEGIKFAADYSEMAVGSGTYIPLGATQSIEFIIDDEVDVASLGIYISPNINNLDGFQVAGIVEKEGFQWGKFFFWIFILLFVAFVVYVALQEWYKRRYESYLFKNPNDLYNIINFIHNSRRNGLDDSETGKKLKDAGWNGEQITYAFKKLDGKRTGLWEIPIFRFLEQRKVRAEIEKRKTQGAQQPSRDSLQAKPLLK